MSNAGRPRLWNDPEAMQAKIDEYFETGRATKQVVTGKGESREVSEIPVPTIGGLVLYLGFEDRHSFHDYEKFPEFTATIRKARQRVAQHYEELGQTQGGSFPIFALKNFGWKDKQDIEMSGGQDIEVTIDKINREE